MKKQLTACIGTVLSFPRGRLIKKSIFDINLPRRIEETMNKQKMKKQLPELKHLSSYETRKNLFNQKKKVVRPKRKILLFPEMRATRKIFT